MRLFQSRGALAAAILAMMTVTVPAGAYQEAGHYYTVALLAYRVVPRLSPADAHIIAFCTQLPDQSADLDAVVVYRTAMTHSTFSWLSWAFSNAADSLSVRRMITVQQLLHGLTGGSAESVRTVARKTVGGLRAAIPQSGGDPSDRAAALCALGFALHLYGDSYAHQMMGSPGEADPDKVYPTGRGHAFDLHYPDLPLCASYSAAPRVATHCETGDTGRFLRWHQGWTRAAELLGEGGTGGSLPNDLEPTVTQKVLLLTQGASDNNLWNEAQMQSTLAAFIAEASPDGAFFSKHTSDESCERVLQAAIQAHLIPTSNAFHCQRAWDKFATVSANAFATTPNSREHQPFDFAKVYLNPLL